MLQAPFPWFGGKSRVAPLIWQRFGRVKNYVEPFFGSGAVLLGNPHPAQVETVNDLDGFLCNFWRAVQADPEAVAAWCDWPVSEADLHARHYWLITEGRSRIAAVLGDPEGCDVQVAGWWVWGLCCWIGGGWCSGKGPWQWTGAAWDGNAGRGISRRLPHLWKGRGINRNLPHLGDAGQSAILQWLEALSARLARVRIAHGDWSRVCGDSVTWQHGLTAVFLDPPYDQTLRDECYSVETACSAAVRDWAVEAGKRDDMRICLAGYDTEHTMPGDWKAVGWKAQGGLANLGEGRGRENAGRETLWFSPACLAPDQLKLI